jgi:hypothetical protein
MTTPDLSKLERGWALIAEGAQEISLAYAAAAASGPRARVPSSAPPPDDLPPLPTFEEVTPEKIAEMVGGEVVPPPKPSPQTRQQLAKESAFTECPAHRRPFKEGRFGGYCTSQSHDPNWSNDKGYCSVTPRSAGAWLKQHPQGAAA